jgi:hypothetical protein
MELISTVLVGSGGTASVTFTDGGAWSGYKHLQIRTIGRTTQTAVDSIQWLRFNGDTGTNYSYHVLYGNGSAVASAGATSQTLARISTDVGANSPANIFGLTIVDVLDAFSTTKNKTIRSLSGAVLSSPWIVFTSGSWMSTTAVTSVTIYPNSGNFVAGSRFSLYGIKG